MSETVVELGAKKVGYRFHEDISPLPPRHSVARFFQLGDYESPGIAYAGRLRDRG